MDDVAVFGSWVRQRRKALDLTQRELADHVGCSIATLKKIEADQRRPSRQLVERLAASLHISSTEQAAFLARARGLSLDQPASLTAEPAPTRAAPQLPAERTTFIGRDTELGQIAAMLADPACRLLTLAGPGGIGKSRLALRAAGQHSAESTVWWIPLAEVAAPAMLATTLVTQLLHPDTAVGDPEASLVSFLAPRAGLLVLDNVEQLLDAPPDSTSGAVELLLRLLDRCSHLKLLVTSREQLNVQAEWLLRLDGLPVDDAAPALFAARARQVRPDFALTGQEEAVAGICRHVEGLPLAIELAAGWTQTLSCHQIAQQLRQQPEALTSRLRDRPARHHSLDQLFDQSWQMLSPDEQAVWMRLAVFAGGCRSTEALAVCETKLSVLQSLVERSLVRGGDGRLRLHSLAQQYAGRKLDASASSADAAHQRHGLVYAALAEQVAQHAFGPEAEVWLRLLDEDRDNLRATWGWAVRQADPGLLYRLMRPSSSYWQERGLFAEGADWMQQLLERTAGDEGVHHTEALLIYSNMRARSGHPREAVPFLLDGFARASSGGDPYLLGIAALNMSQAVPAPDQRLHYGRMAIDALRLAGDQMHLGAMLWMLGDELRTQGEREAARQAYIDSVAVLRQIGNTAAIIYPIGNLGRLGLLEDDVASAQRSFAECVALARGGGNPVLLADWLLRLGVAELYQGQLAEARAALEEALVLAQNTGHGQLVPNLWSWLALQAVLTNDGARAGAALAQSLHGYSALIAIDDRELLSAVRYHERPDLLDALIVAAHVHAAANRMELGVIALSAAARIQATQGYGLEPPLERMVADLTATVRATIDEHAFVRYWEQGDRISVGDVLTRLIELPLRGVPEEKFLGGHRVSRPSSSTT